jgi:hypothetical protein
MAAQKPPIDPIDRPFVGKLFRATMTLVGQSPISFSKPTPPCPKEVGASDHEAEIWRERLHCNSDGHCYIPPTGFYNCVSAVAKYLSEVIPGRGKATYTKHYKAGIAVVDPLLLLNGSGEAVYRDAVLAEELFVNADGVKGSGKRVWRTFPTIPIWRAVANILVLDTVIIPSHLRRYVAKAGQFIGLHRFRPQNGGFYGRYTVEDYTVAAFE